MSGAGTPLALDDSSKARLFGHYVRVLVDTDLSGKIYNNVLVEREGHAFNVGIEYEKWSLFCNNCRLIGHSIQQCNKMANKILNLSKDGKQRHTSNVEKGKVLSENLAILNKETEDMEKQQLVS